MKKKAIYFLLFVAAIILQTSVAPLVFKSNAPGDVVLMLVLAGVILDGFSDFFWWAIFAGILYDLASFVQLGVHALIFLLSIYFVSFFSRRFSVELKGVGIFLFMIFVVVASIISRVVLAFSISADMQSYAKFFALIGGPGLMALQIGFDVILFVLCFYLLKKIKIFFDLK